MSALSDQTLIESIAEELIVDPSFIEKDWYMMRLAAVIAAIPSTDVTVHFAGGTSLSKAYKLVTRFSEDLDFKLILTEHASLNPSQQRSRRRAYRETVLTAIQAVPDWTLQENMIIGDKSRYFQVYIAYQSLFPKTDALRTNLKLEMSFSEQLAFPAEVCPLQSFLAQARRELPEVPQISCVSPVETAADKMSALAWRILARHRETAADDPTIIRHLHDLAALAPLALASDAFAPLVMDTVEQDKDRGKPRTDSLPDLLQALLQTLGNDPLYRTEYQQYVLAMAYGQEESIPSFDTALTALNQLVAHCLGD